ncbi:MAG: hypothetical protein K2X34_01940 [Hyphomonadaceae bacterium]|nr:hypothetical protein [Hyphomonadaceae bacterium]MBY0565123.1 hypothetical protein [Hyphomonadaceae bacterium]
MDFSRSHISMRRPLSSYSKVRAVFSLFLRRWPFRKPYPGGPFYLDIGPGSRIDPSFFNVDYSWSPGIDHCCDITRNFDPPQDLALGIYSEHCFEHLPFEAAIGILTKCHRALVKGGVLRVIMPDLGLYCRQVAATDTGAVVAPMPHRSTKAGISTPAVALNDVMRLHGHLFLWDYDTLAAALKTAGFQTVLRQAFRQGLDPRLLRDTQERAYESLYVEAVK